MPTGSRWVCVQNGNAGFSYPFNSMENAINGIAGSWHEWCGFFRMDLFILILSFVLLQNVLLQLSEDWLLLN